MLSVAPTTPEEATMAGSQEDKDDIEVRQRVAKYLKGLFNQRKKSVGMTQEKLGEQMGGKTQGLVYQYLNGIIPVNVNFIGHYLKALQLTLDDLDDDMLQLMFGTEEQEVLRRLNKPRPYEMGPSKQNMDELLASQVREPLLGYKLVPELDYNASLGHGNEFQNGDVVRRWEVEEALLLRFGVDPDFAIIVPCSGQSMEPTLYDGDLVIVDLGPQKQLSGGLYAIDTLSGSKIKRVNEKNDGTIVVSSDNPNKDAYPTETYDRDTFDDLIKIRGRVVKTFMGTVK